VSATAGTRGFERTFAAGSQPLGEGHLLAAAELQHYDGPFVTPDDARKENLVLRYSQGDKNDGYSVTGMFYHQSWTNTTDIPIRAVSEGLIADRFGTLDPTDGGRALRASLSVQFHASLGEGQFMIPGAPSMRARTCAQRVKEGTEPTEIAAIIYASRA
jgi:hypothetical protein